jgi:hypothetical protein
VNLRTAPFTSTGVAMGPVAHSVASWKIHDELPVRQQTAGCPTSRWFFARCGIPRCSTRKPPLCHPACPGRARGGICSSADPSWICFDRSALEQMCGFFELSL